MKIQKLKEEFVLKYTANLMEKALFPTMRFKFAFIPLRKHKSEFYARGFQRQVFERRNNR